MFSTRPTKPIIFAFAFLRASVFITPATTPAPPMSIVISSIPPAGFNEIPPVSKTTPFPTSANGRSLPPPDHSIVTILDGLSEPIPTPKSENIPSASMSDSSKTLIFKPNSSNPWSLFANSVVVRTLAGSFTRSLVKKTPSTTALKSLYSSRVFDTLVI